MRRLHHLFLIDEDPIGLLQDRLEQGVWIFNRFPAILAMAEHRDIVHRPRPVERHERDDVFKAGRPYSGQRAPHTLGFQLEHAYRVASLEQRVHVRIVP